MRKDGKLSFYGKIGIGWNGSQVTKLSRARAFRDGTNGGAFFPPLSTVPKDRERAVVAFALFHLGAVPKDNQSHKSKLS